MPGGLLQPRHDSEKRGLTGAVRPAEAHSLAPRDLPRDVIQQNAIPERFRQFGELYHSPNALAAAASTWGTRNGFVR